LTRATGISFEADSAMANGAVYGSLSPGEFIQALQELQDKESFSTASGRNIIPHLIEQMDGQVRAGVERIDATVIQTYLARVSEAEELFLKVIEERMPEISKKMNVLQTGGDEVSLHMTTLEGSLQDVAHLRIEAQQVHAGSAMLFFTGLHSLLTLVAQRRVFLAATRVESVKARLHVMGGAIRQWVEHGRAQHAAIKQLLSTGHL
jgi:hypothetical protein